MNRFLAVLFLAAAATALPLEDWNRPLHKFEPAPLNPDGTVAETPEVQHAKAIHMAAYHAELAHADPNWVEPEPQYYSGPSYHHGQPSHSHYKSPFVPAPLNHDGTVADTAAIQKAKNVHFAAHQEASKYAPQGPAYYRFKRAAGHYYEERPEEHHYPIRHFVPAPLNHDGTVDDTEDVKHAKAEFFAMYEKELAHADPTWVEPEPKYQEYRYHNPSY